MNASGFYPLSSARRLNKIVSQANPQLFCMMSPKAAPHLFLVSNLFIYFNWTIYTIIIWKTGPLFNGVPQ